MTTLARPIEDDVLETMAGTSWDHGWFSVVEAEALALKEAIRGVIQLDLNHIIFESDSQLMVQSIHAHSHGNFEFSLIIGSIKNLIISQNDFEVKLIVLLIA